jgi:hypothetical protein
MPSVIEMIGQRDIPHKQTVGPENPVNFREGNARIRQMFQRFCQHDDVETGLRKGQGSVEVETTDLHAIVFPSHLESIRINVRADNTITVQQMTR